MESKNMDFFSKDNILIITAGDEGKKSKKGDGINAILSFLVELRNFREKIDICAETQDITENKQKIEAIGQDLDKHLNALIDVVKGGISAIRKEVVPPTEGPGSSELAPAAPALPASPTPISK